MVRFPTKLVRTRSGDAQAALTAAVLVAALALAIWLWRLSLLLPQRGDTTCFTADYNPPRPVDLSSPRPDQQSTAEVSSMRLEIHFPPNERPFRNPQAGGYDWRYSLRLKAGMTDGSRLSTAAICEWNDTFIDRTMPALFCYIDCDGGSVTVWRKPGQNALTARFEPGERLKTGGSSGESGAVFIGAEREARSFPVALAAAERCK